MPGVAAEAPDLVDARSLVGETLAGRFRIERLVAEGGFGVVYRAQQIALDRPVAIKVFKPAGDLPPERFEVEARTVARLKHPHIVEVHDFGVVDRPAGPALRWMALEWLEGRTLEARLAAGRTGGSSVMTPVHALELLRPAIEAIAFAHREGVVHRDLKPGNIFLADSGGAVTAKVLDFGIASIVAGHDEGHPMNKQAGVAVTTRAFAAFSADYAAPEQVSYGRTGPWTDVHALGLILTELLTGAGPYGNGSAEERFAAVVSEQRPTPKTKGVDAGGWEPVLARALARRPADRYPDAGTLLAALEETLGSGVKSGGGSRRRSLPVAAGVAAALTLLAVATAVWWPSRPAFERPPDTGPRDAGGAPAQEPDR